MELVLLNTAVNLFGILIFYPFLGLIEKFLNSRFASSEPVGESKFIKKVNPEVADVALQSIDNELKEMYVLTQDFIKSSLMLNQQQESTKLTAFKNVFRSEENLLEKYNHLKMLEDELTDYCTLLQEQHFQNLRQICWPLIWIVSD
jgi:phosphate:Na+ symporter